jgi:F-type H+-transporting ATPase subunit b
MQIDWWTLGLQTINFLVLIWLLSRFLYRPIRKVIEEREAADRAASDAAQDREEAAEKLKHDYEAKLRDFEKERAARAAAQHKDLEAAREKRLAEAREEAAQIVEEAKSSITRERTEALHALKGDLVALAADLARKALRGMGQNDGMDGVKDLLAGLSKEDLSDLATELKGDDATIDVITATALSEERRKAWRDMLADRFGQDVKVDFSEDPEVLLGTDLHFPHAVLRFSAADRLDRAAQALEV